MNVFTAAILLRAFIIQVTVFSDEQLTYLQFCVTSGKASRTGHAHPAKEGVTGNEWSGQKTGPGPDDSTDYNPET